MDHIEKSNNTFSDYISINIYIKNPPKHCVIPFDRLDAIRANWTKSRIPIFDAHPGINELNSGFGKSQYNSSESLNPFESSTLCRTAFCPALIKSDLCRRGSSLSLGPVTNPNIKQR